MQRLKLYKHQLKCISYTIITCHLLFNTYTRIVVTDNMLHYARIIDFLAEFLGILHINCKSIKRLHQ